MRYDKNEVNPRVERILYRYLQDQKGRLRCTICPWHKVENAGRRPVHGWRKPQRRR